MARLFLAGLKPVSYLPQELLDQTYSVKEVCDLLSDPAMGEKGRVKPVQVYNAINSGLLFRLTDDKGNVLKHGNQIRILKTAPDGSPCFSATAEEAAERAAEAKAAARAASEAEAAAKLAERAEQAPETTETGPAPEDTGTVKPAPRSRKGKKAGV